jgi:hypothetical protein
MMIPPRCDYQCYYRKVDCTRSYHLQLLLDIMIDIRPIGDNITEEMETRRRRPEFGGLKAITNHNTSPSRGDTTTS